MLQRLKRSLLFTALAICQLSCLTFAQDKSVKPGINDAFKDPKVVEFVERFEIESREVFAKRQSIIEAIDVPRAGTVADIGAGTGVFTRLLSDAVGHDGHVIAVDIAQTFLDHIDQFNRQSNRKNVQTKRCTQEVVDLPAESVDLIYICDTYHHFEYPNKTLQSLRQALKPNGRLVVIDFKRIEGVSTDWTMNHVRGGQEVFEAEIVAAGFRKVAEHKSLLEENYCIEFAKQ